MAFEYLDRSIEVMKIIMSGGLTVYPEITNIDESGGMTFASVGTMSFDGSDVAVGIKYRHYRGATSPRNRMAQELNVASILHDGAPIFRDRLPLFIGQISVGDRIQAVITEDVTLNGLKQIWSTSVSEEDIELLEELFPDDEERGSAFERYTLRRATAFDVDGVNRWLDFTPTPLSEKYFKGRDHITAVYDRIPDLTWSVGSLSEIGIADSYYQQLEE